MDNDSIERVHAHQRQLEKAREVKAKYDREILESCQRFEPIVTDRYIYPHSFNLGYPGMIAHNPTRFAESPYKGEHVARMEYAQGAAFARWQSEDINTNAETGWHDSDNPIAHWMRRLMEVSNHYCVFCQRTNANRSISTHPTWFWEYHLATQWAASMLAPLIADWDLVFRYDAATGVLHMDFQLNHEITLSTPAHYMARSIFEHARKTGSMGDMVAGILTYQQKLTYHNRELFYRRLVQLMERHGLTNRAASFYFHLRPDIRTVHDTDLLVPVAECDQLVDYQAARTAFKAAYGYDAPDPVTVFDIRRMGRTHTGHIPNEIIQWYWYCQWRYGYALDWKTCMRVTDTLESDHPMIGMRRWLERY